MLDHLVQLEKIVLRIGISNAKDMGLAGFVDRY